MQLLNFAYPARSLASLPFLVAASALFSCHGPAKLPDKDPAPLCISDSLNKIISIDTASLQPLDDQLNLSGEFAFDDRKVVRVFPFSSGQVIQVNVSVGDHVKKGQVLAIIRSAEVAGEYADLENAGKDMATAKRQMENSESLYRDGLASEKDYQEARENYQKAAETYRKIREQLAINGGGQTDASGLYRMLAPISGYVVEQKTSAGSFLRGDHEDNLFTIGDIGELWIWANVYESDISKVKIGSTARVTTLAYPDRVFTGHVEKINQILDPESRVMKIRIRIPNPNLELKPEMFASIAIQIKTGSQAVSVPASAVITDNGRHFVIVYHDRCRLESREIDVIRSTNGQSFVRSGIASGERLITRNQILLYNALKEQ